MTPSFTPTAKQLEKLQTASSFAYSLWLAQHPELVELVSELGVESVVSADHIHDLVNGIEAESLSELQRKLRLLRAALMTHFIWVDALNNTSVEELTHSLSVFAEAVVQLSLTKSTHWVMEQKKLTQQPKLWVVAMGKLGGYELNLSSDIDLVVVAPNTLEYACETGSKEALPIQTKIVQRMLECMSSVTADGFVFRVDLRLRPWGEGSAVVTTLTQLAKYFEKHARSWERFAWQKARVIAGGESQRIEALREPFVYRHYVDYTAFAALREMKQLIQQQVAQRGDISNVKLGAGGIRDIEFVVQAHQLLYGGQDEQVRQKSCIQAMRALQTRGHFTTEQFEVLYSAYLFLRRVEHGVQAQQDEQTQSLPVDPKRRSDLAATLGFNNWEAFYLKLETTRAGVEAEFTKLIEQRGQQIQNTQSDFLDASVGAEDPRSQKRAADLLNEFLTSRAYERQPQVVKDRLGGIWSEVSAAIMQSLEPETAAKRMIQFLEATLSRSIYFVLLKENQGAIRHLVRMNVASPLIASELKRYPVLVDSFLLTRFAPLPSKTELADKLDQLLLRVEPSDDESLATQLRIFKKNQLLQIAASDVLARRPLMKVSDSLTELAEVVLGASLRRLYADMVSKHGAPMLQNGLEANFECSGFAIVGYGKLGGIELSYTSDLDLVFVHNINERADTTGEKPISGLKFATRLAQKLMTLLGTQTRDGRVYEVDTRLRPSGVAGVLVTSLAALSRYQHEQAWVWEHQALVRARAIYGDPDVLQSFNELRSEIVSQSRDLFELKQEVLHMRAKMKQHLSHEAKSESAAHFHLKQDSGGIVDIEFLAQFFVLGFSNQDPKLVQFTDNVRIFEALEQCKLAAVQDYQIDFGALKDCYVRLRHELHQRGLMEAGQLVEAAPWQDTRSVVTESWSKVFG